MKKNIIQSATEPDKNSLWLSPQGLKKFSKKGWELIGGSTGEDPSSGGSNDYILPFTFMGSSISSKDFDEIKEAINSGKIIKHKNENNKYRTITHSIIKEDTISLFIGDFDENTQIIYISPFIMDYYVLEYSINGINMRVVHDIKIYDNNGEGISVQQTGIVNNYQPINGYSLGIFNSFGGECIIDDGIYNISHEDGGVIGQCIIYTTSNENGNKIITLIRNEVPDNDSVPGFVYGREYYINSSNESTELTDFNIYYSNDINLLNSIKNANKEISNTYINNKITKFIFKSYNNINGETKYTCVYKYNTLDQLYNELYFIDKINNILIIDYSDINDSLPQKYPDITNKLLYITGLWDYTPDNGSLTKRFIPAIYTYNGAGSFTINYKVDISGPYEKKQIVGMIYYNGADKINHTYHTVCPSYTINLNVQDGTNTGTFDNNNINIYREVRQTIYGGGQIVIKGDATTNYVEAETVATDHVVLRWSVPRIEEDGTSVTLSVYELKLTPEDYTTKVIHKTI